jgi:Ty3 transposon capsid-like protein
VYLLDHEPPDWELLTRLVSSRFKRINTINTLDDLKSLNQHGTIEEYWLQFEKLRSRILLEGRNFSERDFIDTFVSGLKGEIKPFVLAFKPTTVDEDENIHYIWRMQQITNIRNSKLSPNLYPP